MQRDHLQRQLVCPARNIHEPNSQGTQQMQVIQQRQQGQQEQPISPMIIRPPAVSQMGQYAQPMQGIVNPTQVHRVAGHLLPRQHPPPPKYLPSQRACLSPNIRGQGRFIPQTVPEPPPPMPGQAPPPRRQCRMCNRVFDREPPYVYVRLSGWVSLCISAILFWYIC